MASYLKLFETHTQYETFIGGGGGDTPFVRPNVSYCVQENEVHYNPLPHDYSKDYLTFVALENTTFTFTPANNNVISYSMDNGDNWSVGNSVELTKDNKVLWRGKMTPTSSNGVGKFSSTGRFEAQGNVISLLFGDEFKGKTDLTGKNYAFYGLFSSNSKLVNAQNISLPAITLADSCYREMFDGCTSLVNAPSVLPATTLATNCYRSMFYGCTSLVNAPTLPVTTLADSCYFSMFNGCTSLTTAPELPATKLATNCYQNMFSGCTNLVNAPVLPATTLSYQCYYNMFNGCTSLTTAPELPATTLANYCYNQMFSGCTNLVNAPELPATTLANYCYKGMFFGCTGLTTAPVLPATTLADNCYDSMFNGCTSLTTAPTLPATKLANYCYIDMFNGCTSLTTAPTLPATKLTRWCYYNMFGGTNVLPDCSNIDFTSNSVVSSGGLIGLFAGTKVTDSDLDRLLPKNTNGKYYLPVTTLADSCYDSMFRGCTGLTTAPELPATTLSYQCYDGMFSGCSSLKYIKCLATDISATECLSNWVRGVSATGTFVKAANMTSWTTGISGIPSGWTVVTE